MTAGKNIRKLRKEKGLTQKKLGELCGMNEVQIRQYELGKANPKYETLKKIADALDVPIQSLMENNADEHSTVLDNKSQFDSYYTDNEALEIAQFLKNNPDYKVLFDATRNVKAEDIETVKSILDKFKD